MGNGDGTIAVQPMRFITTRGGAGPSFQVLRETTHFALCAEPPGLHLPAALDLLEDLYLQGYRLIAHESFARVVVFEKLAPFKGEARG